MEIETINKLIQEKEKEKTIAHNRKEKLNTKGNNLDGLVITKEDKNMNKEARPVNYISMIIILIVFITTGSLMIPINHKSVKAK